MSEERAKVQMVGDETFVAIIDSTSDSLNVFSRFGAMFDFEIKEPWGGDSETGFLRECSVSLDGTAARQLADWIYSRLAQSPGEAK